MGSVGDLHNQKLTIAHFMPWNSMGGVEIATLRMVEATAGIFRNVAFCLHAAVDLRKAFEKSGIETVAYAPPEPSARHGTRFYKESRQVAQQIRECGADIVHFADEEAAYHNSYAALLARVRIVCHLRSTYSHLSLRQRLCLWPIHSFVFVSKKSRESLAGYVPDDKARVIYDYVEAPNIDLPEANEAVRLEFGIPPSCNLIGMVARVAPVKDYYTLASAAVEVLTKYPDTRFLIVGDNALGDLNRRHYSEVMLRLKELNVEDRFIFTGHRSDVSRLIAAMDICVLCSHREGFPLSILEMMAMRKPVIATAVGGIPEIITPGINGYLHQHGNSRELADAIISLIKDPEKAKDLGYASAKNVHQNYSREGFLKNISKAYLDVMSR